MELQDSRDLDQPAAKGGDARQQHGIVDRLGFLLFLAAVALCPLPDGSNDLIWTVVWGALASVSVLLLSYRSVTGGAAAVILACGVVAAAYIVVAVLQSQTPGPFPLPIWDQASRLIGIDLPPLSTAVRDAPLMAVGPPILASLLFIAGVVLSDDGRRAELVYRVLIAVACISGLIGLAALLLDIGALRPANNPGALTTFFLNKNTTSTYLGSALLMCLALLLVRVRLALRQAGGRLVSLDALAPTPSAKRILGGLVAAALILAMLVPLARSRASLAIVLVLAVLCGLSLFRRRVGSWLIIAPLALAAFALAFLVAGEGVMIRFALRGLEDAGRAAVYRSMVEGVAAHPLLGYGLGTFPSVFPVVRDPSIRMEGVWSMGHSTPLELAFVGGLPLAGVVFAFFGLCLVLLLRGVIRRPNDPYIMGALLVGLLGALHSMVDFTLQIPGYLMIYAAVAGLGVGRALRPANAGAIERVRRRRASVPDAEPSAG
ncbi:O-antigen ligase family protein [Xanthobacter sp. KR7-225]|uniref:O-antigen ligase family protein n=1 Tax=Xanthobacter sp. KR7-225 TaxID=3156613 RepID=UPI0032B3F607